MKRRTIIVLILLALFVAACGGEDDGSGSEEGKAFVEPARPVLTLQTGGNSIEGVVVQYCWPAGVGNLVCDPSFDDQQPSTVTVSQDSEITVDVGTGLQPSELVMNVTRPSEVDVVTSTYRGNDEINAASLSVNQWSAGRHEIEVTAYYRDLEGTNAVISMLFAVEVSSTAVAGGVTPTVGATETSPPSSTETPTELSPTETPTEPPATVEEATATTEPATATPSPTPTLDLPTATSDAAAVPDVTQEVEDTPTATSEVRPTNTPTMIATTAAPTETATLEPTERPSTTPEPVQPSATATSDTSMPVRSTATNTPFGFDPTATFTQPPPTATITPSPSSTPTFTSTPTSTPTAFMTATSPGDDVRGFLGEAPKVHLRSLGRDYYPAGIEFCRWNEFDEQICIERASDIFSARLRIRRGSAVVAEIDDERPSMVRYEIATTPFSPLVTEVRPGDNVILFNVDLPAGTYFLTFEVTWPDMRGTYYFRVQILE